MRPFAYERPTRLDEAVALLADGAARRARRSPAGRT